MMNKTLLIALACVVVPAAFAAPDQPKKAVSHDKQSSHITPARYKEILKKYDKNHDGKLSDDERRAWAKENPKESQCSEELKKYDKNGDGKIAGDELKDYRKDNAKKSTQPSKKQAPKKK